MKSKETIIKTTIIVCLTILLTTSAFFLIKGWIGGHFQSMDTLRIYSHLESSAQFSGRTTGFNSSCSILKITCRRL